MLCLKCGWKESDEAIFCGRCGIPLKKTGSEIKTDKEQAKSSYVTFGGILVVSLVLVVIIVAGYTTKQALFTHEETHPSTKNIASDTKRELYDEYPQTFVCPESRVKELQISDIEKLSDADLRLCRNEIYARHGFVFGVKDLREHFEKLPWYQQNEKYDINALSKIEKRNAKFIRDYEKGREGISESLNEDNNMIVQEETQKQEPEFSDSEGQLLPLAIDSYTTGFRSELQTQDANPLYSGFGGDYLYLPIIKISFKNTGSADYSGTIKAIFLNTKEKAKLGDDTCYITNLMPTYSEKCELVSGYGWRMGLKSGVAVQIYVDDKLLGTIPIMEQLINMPENPNH